MPLSRFVYLEGVLALLSCVTWSSGIVGAPTNTLAIVTITAEKNLMLMF